MQPLPTRNHLLKPHIFILSLFMVLLSLSSATVSAQNGVLPLPGDESRDFGLVTPLAATPSQAASLFGSSVALDGDRIVVGARDYDGTGKVFVFERNSAGVWSQVATLTGLDTAAGDEFGFSVAIEGNTIMIGARKQGADDKGAVYVFTRDSAGMWTQQAKLQPALVNFNYFGRHIDIDGNRVAIAASGNGSAYVYQRDSTGQWNLEIKLPTTLFDTNEVALDGTRVAVSTLTEDMYAGAVYIYEPVSGVWTETGHVTASDGIDFDYFGSALALEGDRLFVGSPFNASNGAVYVFQRNAGVWSEQQKLTADDGQPDDVFGNALTLDGNVLMIGADGDAADLGSAYRFGWDGTSWSQQSKIEAVSGRFGFKLDLQNGTLVAAAPDNSGEGRVYVYTDPALVSEALLVDGGFESEAAGWSIKNASSDKVKCNKPEKIFAYEGLCAWRFKGGAGENAKLQQVITSGVNAGDTLSLSGYVSAAGSVNGKLKIVVKYLDTTLPKSKITVSVNSPTSDYVSLSTFQPALTTDITASIDKIKVSLRNQGESGKVYYDALSLIVQ